MSVAAVQLRFICVEEVPTADRPVGVVGGAASMTNVLAVMEESV